MSASRPEAETEYSSADSAPDRPAWGRILALILAATGALGLILAEFLALQRVVTIAARPVLVRVVSAGAHDGFALVPVAVLGLLLAFVGVVRPAGASGRAGAGARAGAGIRSGAGVRSGTGIRSGARVRSGAGVRARVAFLAVAVLGVIGLLIALLVDRSGLHAVGSVRVAGMLMPAQVRAGAGIYVETLGAALLLLGGVLGALW